MGDDQDPLGAANSDRMTGAAAIICGIICGHIHIAEDKDIFMHP